MKKLICYLLVILSTASITYASPFAVTGEFPTDAVSSCKFTLNGGSAVNVTPTELADNTKSICTFDIDSSVNGNNVVSVVYATMWGSSTAVPFS